MRRTEAMIARYVWAGLTVLLLAAVPARAVEVQRVVSPGGIEAWLVEDHGNPIISLDLAFQGGAALDPAGQEGLAYLVSGLLDEGAGDRASQPVPTRRADLSLRLSFDAGLDSFQGSLRTLTENREAAFEMLNLALTQARFDPEPVERIRSQILVHLDRETEDPNTIASRALRRALFPDHPYGRPVNGTLETMPGITVEDLRGFVAERLARNSLYVAVVGDIKAGELAHLLDHTFLDLPDEAAPFTLPEVTPRATGEVIVIEREVPQSVVAFGHGGIKRDDHDFYAAYIANYVLGGGGFASRLYEEVREKRGLAYSVYSYLSPLDHAGLILGGVATANVRVAESLEVIREEWARMGASGPSAEELKNAKTYLTGSYPLRFSSTAGIAGMLLAIQLEDLGIDYVNLRNDLIEAVDMEDVRRASAELYRTEDLTFVIVGQPDGVASGGAGSGEGG